MIDFVVRQIDEIAGNQQLSNEQKLSSQEYCIFVLGVLLKVLMYNDVSERKEDIISDREVYELFNYTFLYREINELIQSWMFGDVEIIKDEFLEIKELPGNNQNRVISAISYWDIKGIKNLKAYINEFEKTGSWQDNLNVYCDTLKGNIKEDFYTQDFQEEYFGIPLYKWVNIYKLFADKAYNINKPIIKYQRNELFSEISKLDFTPDKAEEILKRFVFQKNSKDLFDSFLIENKSELLFCPKIFLFIDGSKAMLSLMGKNEKDITNVEQKGKGFERHIFKIIKKQIQKLDCNIETNYRGEDYELDLVFLLDDDLFICECKTQYQHEDVRGY